MKPAFATTAVILFALVFYTLQRVPSPEPETRWRGAEEVGDTPRPSTPDPWAEVEPPGPDVAAAPAPGEVASGPETDEPDLVPLAGPSDAPRETVTVRPGDSLWAIAERVYGDGGKARTIYEANRDQVADPARIYPGQELVLP